jgi:hypothetical protein
MTVLIYYTNIMLDKIHCGMCIWYTQCFWSWLYSYIRVSGGYYIDRYVIKSAIFWDITLCNPLKVRWLFRGKYHLQGQRISWAWNQCKRATRCHLPEDDNHHSHRRGNLKSYNVKTGGKQSNWPAEILDYVWNRIEMKEQNSVPVGLLAPTGRVFIFHMHTEPHDKI